jgi:signal peptidase I
MKDNEGLITGQVHVDHYLKKWSEPKRYDKNLFSASVLERNVIIPLDIFIGQTSYFLSTYRKKRQQTFF